MYSRGEIRFSIPRSLCFLRKYFLMSSEIKHRIVIALSLLFMAITVVAGIFLLDIPCRDVAGRYAPMAEAFAEGDWQYAFHPRIPPLQTICGGIIAKLTGLGGFMALKTASLLWHLAGAMVLFKLLRELYPETEKRFIAAAGVAFYAFFPYTFHMAYSGLREPAKSCLLLLIALAVTRICRNIRDLRAYLLLGISCGLSMFNRADMVIVGSFCIFCAGVVECRERRFPAGTLLAGAAAYAVNFFNILINWRIAGSAMPDFRFNRIFQDIFHRAPEMTDGILCSIAIVIMIAFAAYLAEKFLRIFPPGCIIELAVMITAVYSLHAAWLDPQAERDEFVWSIIKGCYHFAGAFILLTILVKWYFGKLSTAEGVICLIVLGNIVLNILAIEIFHHQLYISSRYIFTAMPLLAGFFVIGVDAIYCFLCRYVPKLYVTCLLILCCAAMAGGFFYHMFQPILRDYTRKNDIRIRQTIWELAEIIRKDYDGPEIRRENIRMDTYVSKHLPVMALPEEDKISVAGFLAGGSATLQTTGADYFVGRHLPRHLRRRAKKIGSVINFRKMEIIVWRIRK